MPALFNANLIEHHDPFACLEPYLGHMPQVVDLRTDPGNRSVGHDHANIWIRLNLPIDIGCPQPAETSLQRSHCTVACRVDTPEFNRLTLNEPCSWIEVITRTGTQIGVPGLHTDRAGELLTSSWLLRSRQQRRWHQPPKQQDPQRQCSPPRPATAGSKSTPMKADHSDHRRENGDQAVASQRQSPEGKPSWPATQNTKKRVDEAWASLVYALVGGPALARPPLLL